MTPRVIEDLIRRIEQGEGLDRVVQPVGGAVAKVLPAGLVKDALNGTWLGHPVHPMLTDVVIGAWTSAFFLDLFGGQTGRRAADALVGLGVVSAVPTAAAGLADWSDISKRDKRVGLIHALANVTATTLYGMSYLARRKGDRRAGVTLGMLGAATATAGGHLGGHLSYRRGVNVSRNAWDQPSSEWEPLIEADHLPEGRPVVARAGENDVLLVRNGADVSALDDVCSHAGGPLHEGTVERGCVTCPLHGSTFRLADGSVVHGPATAPQPPYETRIQDGTVAGRRKG